MASSSSMLDVRQLLDLEAAVDRGGYDSEEDEEDEGFIDDGEGDQGLELNYHAVDVTLDNQENNSDHDSLFSGDDEDVHSEHGSIFSGDEEMEVEGTAEVGKDTVGDTIGDTADELDNTMNLDDSVKYQAREVWIVKCKRYKEKYVIEFLERYTKKYPQNTTFLSFQAISRGCGYVLVHTRDAAKAASAIRGCAFLRRKKGNTQGVDMVLVNDPVDIARTLSGVSSVTEAIVGARKNPGFPHFRVNQWIRLGPTVEPKNIEPTRKKKQSSKPTRAQSFEPAEPEPGLPLYYDDPALILSIDNRAVTVLFIPRIPATTYDKTLKTRCSKSHVPFVQSLVYESSEITSQEDVRYAWDHTLYDKITKIHSPLPSYPDGRFEHGMRVQIVDISMIKPLGRLPNAREGRILFECTHSAVSANFPAIDDWRFDLGDLVRSPNGHEGLVVSHSSSGPVVDYHDPIPDEGPGNSIDFLTRHATIRVGEQSFGWKLQKVWFVGDCVRHISGVEGFVVSLSEDRVTVRDSRVELNYDFSGHTNSFRLANRQQHARGYTLRREPEAYHSTPWMEAAVIGPHRVTDDKQWDRFREDWNENLALRRIPQQVFVLEHWEATEKLKKARTGTIPWKGHRVLISGKKCQDKGHIVTVYDVHINQLTNSGLAVTVESQVVGRLGQRSKMDYDDIVDEFWQLPLHLVERPMNKVFMPKRNGYWHPNTYHIAPVRSTTPPVRVRRGERQPSEEYCSAWDPSHRFDDEEPTVESIAMVQPTPLWKLLIRHPSQAWLYNSENTKDLWFKARITGTIGTRKFSGKVDNVCVVTAHDNSARNAVVEYYKKQHEIPTNVQVDPVNPVANTRDPIFIFRGEHANTVAYRHSSGKYGDDLFLHGYAVLMSEKVIDFRTKLKFLPSDACVLHITNDIRDALHKQYNARRR